MRWCIDGGSAGGYCRYLGPQGSSSATIWSLGPTPTRTEGWGWRSALMRNSVPGSPGSGGTAWIFHRKSLLGLERSVVVVDAALETDSSADPNKGLTRILAEAITELATVPGREVGCTFS